MLCRKMNNMKVFRVTGEIYKPNLKTQFVRELLADKSEHAVKESTLKLAADTALNGVT